MRPDRVKRAALIGVAMAGLLLTAAAQAQSVAELGGPAVTGVCLLSREAVLANAKVSVSAHASLNQLAQQAQSEIDTARQPLEAELAALQAESKRLSEDERRKRQQQLSERAQAVQAKAAHRSREIEATRAKALGHIADELQPVLQQVYKARGCGLLLERAAVLGGNLANDLTQAVIEGLDARITSFPLQRESLPEKP